MHCNNRCKLRSEEHSRSSGMDRCHMTPHAILLCSRLLHLPPSRFGNKKCSIPCSANPRSRPDFLALPTSIIFCASGKRQTCRNSTACSATCSKQATAASNSTNLEPLSEQAAPVSPPAPRLQPGFAPFPGLHVLQSFSLFAPCPESRSIGLESLHSSFCKHLCFPAAIP